MLQLWRAVATGKRQAGFPYTLYRLGELAADWCPTEQLGDEVLLPAIRHEILLETGENPTWHIEELLKYALTMPPLHRA
jgi:hypothetical protein